MIGRTTEEQMPVGIDWGYVAMMEGLVERMKAGIGRPVTIVATGGLAALFDEHSDQPAKGESRMTGVYVNIDLPGEAHPRRGRLLAQVQPHGSLPLLQIYDSFEYLLALKRHQDGRIEHEEVWVSDDPCDGRCLPVNPRSEQEIRDDLRRFFADDPRAETLVRESPLR